MCTNYSTRNRAVIINNYALQTLLVKTNDYCPCGPNTQDYSYRSRLYNPDPRYQCHLDLTCHAFDSIPKAVSCSGYGSPNMSQSIYSGTMGPASCSSRSESSPRYPPPCRRRVVRPENCCRPKPDMQEFMEAMICCDACEEPTPCCDDDDNEDECPPPPIQPVVVDNCGGDDDTAGYTLEVPQTSGDCCGSKVTYSCGPCGDVRKTVRMPGGNQVQMPCQRPNYLMVDTSGTPACLCGGREARICIDSCTPCGPPSNCIAPPEDCSPCCPPPPCSPPPKICCRPSPCCPRPKRRRCLTRCCPPPCCPSPCSPPPCCPSPCCPPPCCPSPCCPPPSCCSPCCLPPICCKPWPCDPSCNPRPPLFCKAKPCRPRQCCPCPPPPICCKTRPCCPVPCCPKTRTMRCGGNCACNKLTVGPTLGQCGSPCLECRPRFRNP